MAVHAKFYEHKIIVSKSYRPLYLISIDSFDVNILQEIKNNNK